MGQPVKVDIPHGHDRAAVRARLDAGIGKLAGFIPGGAAVDHRWEGDSLHFNVAAMGQQAACRIDVHDKHIHLALDLPPVLALFAGKIREKLAKDGQKLIG